MQTTSLPSRIQVSDSFRLALEAEVGRRVIGGESRRFNLSDRGEMSVKGKGQMHTYFVEPVRRRRNSIVYAAANGRSNAGHAASRRDGRGGLPERLGRASRRLDGWLWTCRLMP